MIHENWRERIKYPVLLFALLVLSKIIYVIVESQYNFQILQTVTSASVSKEDIEVLNDFGHTISAIGFTLLLIPLYFFLFKKLPALILATALTFSSLVSFYLIKEALNKTVEIIVEKNSDKRHNAYYANIFKYGILNNLFKYDSFIPNEHIQVNKLTIDDQMLITNTFLITFADEALIERLKQQGQNKIAELFLSMGNSNDYEQRYTEFKTLSHEMSKAWNQFNKQRIVLEKNLSKASSEEEIETAYKKMQNAIQLKYIAYIQGTENLTQKIFEATRLYKLQDAQRQLTTYFEYQNYDKAKRKYSQAMNRQFGHYIDPSRWCEGRECPSMRRIEIVIKEEIHAKARKKLNGVPTGLNVIEFLKNNRVKTEVAKKFKEKDILIPKNFDYTLVQFRKYYLAAVSRAKEKTYTDFYKEMQKKIGKNDIKLNFQWKDYVMSDHIANKIKSKLPSANEKTINRIQTLLISKDIGSFKNEVYLPSVSDEIQKKLFTKEQFNTDKEAIKKGNEAIKLLYVPPFALSLSMISLLLNLVTVIAMLTMLLSISNVKAKFILKPILYAFFIFLPFTIGSATIQNKLVKETLLTNTDIDSYVKFLHWLKFYEVVNVKIQK